MIGHRFIYLMLSLASLAITTAAGAISSVAAFARETFALFKPQGVDQVQIAGGHASFGGNMFSIDPALFNANRHEAGVSRRSAARSV